MKKSIYLCLLSFALLYSCKTAPKELPEDEITTAKSTVQVAGIRYGNIEDELLFSASTIYLKRNVVTSPIPAFITNVKVKLGDAVSKGDVLYELESKERLSLGSNAAGIDSSLANFGLVKVRASGSGIISTLDKQQPGDYVLEGTQLCTIAESTDLAFQVNVPYEFVAFTRQGVACKIALPDNSIHNAYFTKSLTSMNALSQTQTILAKTTEKLFLPENMIVKVLVNKSSDKKNQVLPKSAVLSDEMMQEFWIMKLISDSVAIKVPVTIGNKNNDKVEILEPVFNTGDQIIINGNYGLPDTAIIRIGK